VKPGPETNEKALIFVCGLLDALFIEVLKREKIGLTILSLSWFILRISCLQHWQGASGPSLSVFGRNIKIMDWGADSGTAP
jgi:hypothetical protein